MATGRNSKPVQLPGAAQTQATATDTQDTSTTAAPSTGGEGSQSTDSSQLQAGGLGHPDASNTAGNGETQGSAQAPESAPPVTLTAEQFNTLMGRLEAAEAKIENREQAEIVQKVELPSVKDLDLSKLKTPVLTQEGWLVPDVYGSNPNNK